MKLKRLEVVPKFCCLCGGIFLGKGHNPWPLNKEKGAECCDKCNNKVLAERISRSLNKKKRGVMKGDSK